jgi:hypothetical protein
MISDAAFLVRARGRNAEEDFLPFDTGFPD